MKTAAISLLFLLECAISSSFLDQALSNFSDFSQQVDDSEDENAISKVAEMELRSVIRTAEALKESIETTSCLPPWKRIAPRVCLLAFPQLRGTWNGARRYCRERGGDLPLPAYWREASAMMRFVERLNAHFRFPWLALRRRKGSSFFTKPDGRIPYWLPQWTRGLPNIPNSIETCASFYSKDWKMKLWDWGCRVARAIICQKRMPYVRNPALRKQPQTAKLVSQVLLSGLDDAVTALQKELGPPKRTSSCSPPWEATELGLCLLFPELRGSWTESRKYCLRAGGDLSLPVDEKEAEAMIKLARQKVPFSRYWLALRRQAGSSIFVDPVGKERSWQPPWDEKPLDKAPTAECAMLYSKNETMIVRKENCTALWPDAFCQKRMG